MTCACVSRDKRYIATADRGPNSVIVVWDAQSGTPIKTFFDVRVKQAIVAQKGQLWFQKKKCFVLDSLHQCERCLRIPIWISIHCNSLSSLTSL